MFRVAKPNPDIYLVLRIEKVLQGDPDSSFELYSKYDLVRNVDARVLRTLLRPDKTKQICAQIKEKDKERLETHVKDCCKHFGEYRQVITMRVACLARVLNKPIQLISVW